MHRLPLLLAAAALVASGPFVASAQPALGGSALAPVAIEPYLATSPSLRLGDALDLSSNLLLVPCSGGYQGNALTLWVHQPGVNGVWWDSRGHLWTGVNVFKADTERWNLKVGNVCAPYAWERLTYWYYYEWRIA